MTGRERQRAPTGICNVRNRVVVLLWLGVLCIAGCTPPLPYDEDADAHAAVERALARAGEEHKLVLLTFGANWCGDCRAFDRAIEDPAVRGHLDDRFVRVKIDVGNWDRNPDIVAAWGNPTAEGIPAIVVATPDRQILFATRRGQTSTARDMSREQFIAFFDHLASLAN